MAYQFLQHKSAKRCRRNPVTASMCGPVSTHRTHTYTRAMRICVPVQVPMPVQVPTLTPCTNVNIHAYKDVNAGEFVTLHVLAHQHVQYATRARARTLTRTCRQFASEHTHRSYIAGEERATVLAEQRDRVTIADELAERARIFYRHRTELSHLIVSLRRRLLALRPPSHQLMGLSAASWPCSITKGQIAPCAPCSRAELMLWFSPVWSERNGARNQKVMESASPE